ncbi:NAD(P) transhydrogenase subunit alpha [Arthrobacter oryzae]|uniref:proton-translocating NAD(P)(+) transhydrogenase n=1 Tax=Arthrobacter oryzae TaxID=409290 RepID=A0A495ERU2_9MICC|nr:NAD(P) transhydrogenase subunit alpha [Arthrobacter oryzae]RKR19705.1 pyridine nucleotide transhydrogenase-like protein [Arthrobacter oryzae]
MGPVALLTVVVLAVFVGFEVVSKVTSKLHTPLMSGANAIHGIILVGAIIVAGQAGDPWVLGIALLAVVLATVNLVGGFVVTDRMLEMFSGHRQTRKPAQPGGAQPGAGPAGGSAAGESADRAGPGGAHPRKGTSGGVTGEAR